MSDTPFADGLLSSLAPWAPTGSDFANFTNAIATMFEGVYDLVADTGSPDEPAAFTAGWSTLLDPNACPAAYLPYCGAFVGVIVPPGMDEATARAKIIAEQNFNRGTGFAGVYDTSTTAAGGGGAIVTAAQRFLTGDQSVTLLERTAADGDTEDAYHFVLICLASELSSADQLSAAVDAVRPAGVQWTLIPVSSWTITQVEDGYSTVADVEAAFATISNLETDVT